MVRFTLVALVAAFFAVASVRASEIVVLGEQPVAEFTLPDGSILKNAFVWRRSSQGLMIVHDGGQYFLNFALLPDDWKVAYLGEPEVIPEEPVVEPVNYEISDPYELKAILERIPNLKPENINYILRVEADEASEKMALGLAILQSLLDGEAADARRLVILMEEMEIEIEGVTREELSETCSVCEGVGDVERTCASCKGSGKCVRCEGEGKRRTGIGDNTLHCTTCKGSGKCRDCAGEGEHLSVCNACKGRGVKVLTSYCKARRDLFVQAINPDAEPGASVNVVQADEARIMQTLFSIPDLSAGAVHYYGSDAYDGAMDTNILVICLMHSALNNNFENAARFAMSIKVNYGEDEVLDVEKYLDSCKACEGSGIAEKDCTSCNGSGDCKRCGGDGERDTDFRDRTIPCTTCRGTGKCTGCGGSGVRKVRCSTCGGSGQRVDRERTEIKRKLLAKKLSDYYRSQR